LFTFTYGCLYLRTVTLITHAHTCGCCGFTPDFGDRRAHVGSRLPGCRGLPVRTPLPRAPRLHTPARLPFTLRPHTFPTTDPLVTFTVAHCRCWVATHAHATPGYIAVTPRAFGLRLLLYAFTRFTVLRYRVTVDLHTPLVTVYITRTVPRCHFARWFGCPHTFACGYAHTRLARFPFTVLRFTYGCSGSRLRHLWLLWLLGCLYCRLRRFYTVGLLPHVHTLPLRYRRTHGYVTHVPDATVGYGSPFPRLHARLVTRLLLYSLRLHLPFSRLCRLLHSSWFTFGCVLIYRATVAFLVGFTVISYALPVRGLVGYTVHTVAAHAHCRTVARFVGSAVTSYVTPCQLLVTVACGCILVACTRAPHGLLPLRYGSTFTVVLYALRFTVTARLPGYTFVRYVWYTYGSTYAVTPSHVPGWFYLYALHTVYCGCPVTPHIHVTVRVTATRYVPLHIATFGLPVPSYTTHAFTVALAFGWLRVTVPTRFHTAGWLGSCRLVSLPSTLRFILHRTFGYRFTTLVTSRLVWLVTVTHTVTRLPTVGSRCCRLQTLRSTVGLLPVTVYTRVHAHGCYVYTVAPRLVTLGCTTATLCYAGSRLQLHITHVRLRFHPHCHVTVRGCLPFAFTCTFGCPLPGSARFTVTYGWVTWLPTHTHTRLPRYSCSHVYTVTVVIVPSRTVAVYVGLFTAHTTHVAFTVWLVGSRLYTFLHTVAFTFTRFTQLRLVGFARCH